MQESRDAAFIPHPKLAKYTTRSSGDTDILLTCTERREAAATGRERPRLLHWDTLGAAVELDLAQTTRTTSDARERRRHPKGHGGAMITESRPRDQINTLVR